MNRNLKRYEKTAKDYNMANKAAGILEARAKSMAHEEPYISSDGKDGRRIAIRIVKQRTWEALDIYQPTLERYWQNMRESEQDEGITVIYCSPKTFEFIMNNTIFLRRCLKKIYSIAFESLSQTDNRSLILCKFIWWKFKTKIIKKSVVSIFLFNIL